MINPLLSGNLEIEVDLTKKENHAETTNLSNTTRITLDKPEADVDITVANQDWEVVVVVIQTKTTMKEKVTVTIQEISTSLNTKIEIEMTATKEENDSMVKTVKQKIMLHRDIEMVLWEEIEALVVDVVLLEQEVLAITEVVDAVEKVTTETMNEIGESIRWIAKVIYKFI